jgi:hypothetical protein
MPIHPITILIALTSGLAAAQVTTSPTIYLDADGKTTAALPHINYGEDIHIALIGIANPQEYCVLYRIGKTLNTGLPIQTAMTDGCHPKKTGGNTDYEVIIKTTTNQPNPGTKALLLSYAVLKLAPIPQAITDYVNSYDKRQETLAQLNIAIRTKTTDLAQRNQRLTRLRQDATTFAQSRAPNAIDDLRRLQTRIDQEQTTIEQAERDLDADRSARTNLETVDQTERNKLGVFGTATLDELRALSKSNIKTAAQILKTGALLIGRTHQVFQFEFRYVNPLNTVTLLPLGSPAVLSEGDTFYVQATNRIPAKGEYPLTYKTSVEAGKPINPEPIRPSFEIQALDGSTKEELPSWNRINAYTDELAFMGDDYHGDDKITLTVSTIGPIKTKSTTVDTTDGTAKTTSTEKTETKSFDLASVQLPQVRARYRINFVTGFIATNLREEAVTRTLAGTTTSGTTTTRTYTTKVTSGDVRIKPVAGIMIYPKRVDPLRPISKFERFPLTPTLLFALQTAPADDIFVGGSGEIVRNVQYTVGWHYGKVSKRITQFDDPTDSTTPPSIKVYRGAIFGGLSFNVNIVAKIFKGVI